MRQSDPIIVDSVSAIQKGARWPILSPDRSYQGIGLGMVYKRSDSTKGHDIASYEAGYSVKILPPLWPEA